MIIPSFFFFLNRLNFIKKQLFHKKCKELLWNIQRKVTWYISQLLTPNQTPQSTRTPIMIPSLFEKFRLNINYRDIGRFAHTRIQYMLLLLELETHTSLTSKIFCKKIKIHVFILNFTNIEGFSSCLLFIFAYLPFYHLFFNL
jgi:hypothetical protein